MCTYTRVVRPISIDAILPFGMDEKNISIVFTCAFKLRYEYQDILYSGFLKTINIKCRNNQSTVTIITALLIFLFFFFRESSLTFFNGKSFTKLEVFTKLGIKCCQLLPVDNHRSYYRLHPNQWLA